MSNYGWCLNKSHGVYDHRERNNCVDFVSDEDFSTKMMEEAIAHDSKVSYSKEAAYVEQHRPY